MLGAQFSQKARYEQVTAEIAMKGVRRREFGRFIKSVENLPEMIREFDEALWGSLVEKVTVYSKDRIVFTMTSGISRGVEVTECLKTI